MLDADANLLQSELYKQPYFSVESEYTDYSFTQAIPGILYQYQLSTDGREHFPFINQKIRDYFGYSPAQVKQNPQLMWATVLSQDRSHIEEAVQVSAMHLTPFAVEYRAYNCMGEVRWYVARSIPVRQADGSTLWSGIILDINNRKLAELDCLQALQSLRELNTQLENSSIVRTPEIEELVDWLYVEVLRQEIPPCSHTAQSHLASILLAEDNVENIDIFSTYLVAAGYRVLSACNGLEAVALSKSHHIDLILMDIHMPEMDGLEAIRQIRLGVDRKKTPILTLTALAMPGDRERCFSVGANEYLSKPIRLKHLLERVDYWLQRTSL